MYCGSCYRVEISVFRVMDVLPKFSFVTSAFQVEDYFFASLEGSFSIEECKEKHFTPLPMTVVGQADSQQKTVVSLS